MNCFIFESVDSPGIEGNFACSFHFVQVLLLRSDAKAMKPGPQVLQLTLFQ